jgi:hypothetical protein
MVSTTVPQMMLNGKSSQMESRVAWWTTAVFDMYLWLKKRNFSELVILEDAIFCWS